MGGMATKGGWASDMDTRYKKLIVNGGKEIRNSIQKTINQVDKQGNIPTEWKQMAIRVTHKKGDITKVYVHFEEGFCIGGLKSTLQ